jgi:hypothetical protein
MGATYPNTGALASRNFKSDTSNDQLLAWRVSLGSTSFFTTVELWERLRRQNFRTGKRRIAPRWRPLGWSNSILHTDSPIAACRPASLTVFPERPVCWLSEPAGDNSLSIQSIAGQKEPDIARGGRY